MIEFFKKIANSKYFLIIKRIITLDGDHRFIIPSLTYYLMISLIPLSTIIYFFALILNIDSGVLKNGVIKYTTILATDNIFSFENIFYTIITFVICSFIASTGVLNYYKFLQEKYSLKKMSLPFLFERVHAIFMTFFLCFLFAAIQMISLIFSSDNLLLNIVKYFVFLAIYFLLVWILNYLIMRREKPLKFHLFGSLFSTCLLSVSNVVFKFYLDFQSNTIFFGELTPIISLLVYLYFSIYIFVLGNHINFLIEENKKGDKYHLN